MNKFSSFSLVAAFALASATVAPAVYAIDLIYQETFPWTDDDLGDGGNNSVRQQLESRHQGWCGGNVADPFCNNPPGGAGDNDGGEGAISSGFGNASTVTPSVNVNNDPQGNVVGDSFAFWSQKGITRGFFYTPEYNPDTENVEVVTWDQTDSLPGDPTHLAFCVDGSWYVSEQTWSNGGNPWQSNWARTTVLLSDLTFFIVGDCSDTLPSGEVVAGGLPLPDSQIDAFGFWWGPGKTSNSRFDNVRLFGRHVDDDGPGIPSAPAISGTGVLMLLAGLLGMGGFFAGRRRR